MVWLLPCICRSSNWRELLLVSREQTRLPFWGERRAHLWYLVCRLAIVTVLLGGTGAFYLSEKVHLSTALPLFFLIIPAYAQTAISALVLARLQRLSRLLMFSQVQLTWELVFVSLLIIISGGVESVFSFAYVFVIVAASFLLSRKQTILVAAAAVIMFGGILDLQYFNYLQSIGLTRTLSSQAFLTTVFVHVVAFISTALLSGTLAERWRLSEAELRRKEIDFEELERLNKAILNHISSGLMMINRFGRIRSFNRAAAEITGYRLEEIYDADAKELFGGMVFFNGDEYNLVNRAEGEFVDKTGACLTFGYATTIARGRNGEEQGLLVTFQDLTQLKKVEEQLTRSDRLAAVGRMASGMAHEIRNPLASISGSVQLLMEGTEPSAEDRRLMKIVVKEAERLSGLLTDFLTFARPKTPVKEPVNVVSVLDELIDMLAADHRFENVEIERNYPDEFVVSLDRGQIWQALWDLAVNASEAMLGHGRLIFSVHHTVGPTIVVEDSGPGISADIKSRIFEPFFSTKEKGTGLGLASVYSIIESHNGTVTVDRGDAGGARFSMKFASGEH